MHRIHQVAALVCGVLATQAVAAQPVRPMDASILATPPPPQLARDKHDKIVGFDPRDDKPRGFAHSDKAKRRAEIAWGAARPPDLPLRFFTGGFAIDNAERVADAAADGIEVDITYDSEPSPGDAAYAALQANHMSLIPGKLLDYIEAYGACHEDRSCDEAAILSSVRKYLEAQKNNQLVVGYWILDDWKYTSGSARDFLIKVNALIHEITPRRPSICGFGGGVDTVSGVFDWDDGLAANFSPDGCDMVGLYLYGEHGEDAARYDWTMPKVLDAVFGSLKSRGWDQIKTPLVGIPQAFGGHLGKSWAVPTQRSVETQAKAFCARGAIGIVYYAWNEAVTPSTVLPTNSKEITSGIRRGNIECKTIWGLP